MGDNEWKDITQKKHHSVFERLKFPQAKTSYAGDIAKISLTVKLCLHANVARFSKKEEVKPFHAATSYVNSAKFSINGGGRDVKTDLEESGSNHSLITLKLDYSNYFPLAILGGYKDFHAIANTRSSVSKPKSKNAKVRVNTEESAVKPEPELKNTIGCNLNPSDGPGKPNSIIMKTVKTKWALNQLQQPICVHLTKTVKTLKAQS
ncbi:hypothetical protein Tco_0667314 [Tanacetum coccineum]